MAVFCENYSTEPAIGKCIQIDNDTIEILWMEGTLHHGSPGKFVIQKTEEKQLIGRTAFQNYLLF